MRVLNHKDINANIPKVGDGIKSERLPNIFGSNNLIAGTSDCVHLIHNEAVMHLSLPLLAEK